MINFKHYDSLFGSPANKQPKPSKYNKGKLQLQQKMRDIGLDVRQFLKCTELVR